MEDEIFIKEHISDVDKLLAITAHISYLFFGMGFVIIPLLIYSLSRSSEFVKNNAMYALQMQLMVLICSFVTLILTLLIIGIVLWPVLLCLYLVWLIGSAVACMKAFDGKEFNYFILR